MLSSRDTPMNEDGWALLIEDIRRLALLIGGGANDLNAGAIDADQQAINDLGTALNQHEIDPDAHPELDDRYLRLTDYSAGFTVSYVITTSSSGTTQNMTGALDQLVAAIPDATGTSGMAITSGVFTAPATGVYAVSATIDTNVNQGATAGAVSYEFSVLNQAFAGPTMNTKNYYPAGSGNCNVGSSTLSGLFSMTSGATLKFYAQVVPFAAVTPVAWISHISIARIL